MKRYLLAIHVMSDVDPHDWDYQETLVLDNYKVMWIETLESEKEQ